MSPDLRVLVVGLASYALLSTALSMLVVMAWPVGLAAWASTANRLLMIRLLPSLLGGTLAAGVVLPSFARHEPRHAGESVGALVLALATVAVVLVGHAAWRAWRANQATRVLVSGWPAIGRYTTASGANLDVIDVASPVVALVGLWHPRVVVARRVVQACTPEELAQVAAHEQAHHDARDNLKRWLMTAAPDLLAWLPTATRMMDRWHLGSEEAADAAAVGGSRTARLALASALIKVARLATETTPAPWLVSHLIGVEGLERRVRRLLASDPPPAGTVAWLPLAIIVILPWLAIPLHAHLHAAAEALVSLGR